MKFLPTVDFTTCYRSKFILKAYEGWILPQSTVLDIGCGNCIISERIKDYFNCDITGIDIFDYGKGRIKVRVIKGNKIPFSDRQFDVAMFNDTLHHCQDWEILLQEARRVAKKLLIFEHEPVPKLLDYFINQFHCAQMPAAVNMKASGEWKSYFKDCQLRRIKTPFWYPMKHFAISTK